MKKALEFKLAKFGGKDSFIFKGTTAEFSKIRKMIIDHNSKIDRYYDQKIGNVNDFKVAFFISNPNDLSTFQVLDYQFGENHFKLNDLINDLIND